MTYKAIISLVIYGLFAIVIGIGVLRGLSKGLYKCLVDIGFVIVSLFLSLAISKLIARTVTNVKTLSNMIDKLKGSAIGSSDRISTMLNSAKDFIVDISEGEVVNSIVALPAVILTPLIFIIVFIVLSLIILIPKLILERLIFGSSGDGDYRGGSRVFGGVSGGVCALLTLIVALMPIVGYFNLVGNTMDIISDSENPPAKVEEINTKYIDPLRNNVVAKISYNFGGKLVFKSLSTVKANKAKISLTKEVEAGAKIYTHIDAFRDTPPAEYDERQMKEIDEIAKIVDDVELIPAILSEVASYTSNAWLEGEKSFGFEKPNVGEYYSKTFDEILALFTNMDLKSAKRDVKTLSELGKEGIRSGLVKYLASKQGDLIYIVSDKDFLTKLLTEIYDNENMRPAMPMVAGSIVNYMYKIYDEVNGTSTPWPKRVDITTVTREEIELEGAYISQIIRGILDFEDSIADVDRIHTELYIKTARVKSLGKSFDAMHDSIFFSPAYEFMVRTILSSEICRDMKFVDKDLIDTALNAKVGMQDFLVAMQRTAIVNLYLDKKKDINKEDYQKALRDLIMNSTHDTADSMSASLKKDKLTKYGMSEEKADAMSKILEDLLESSANVNSTLSEAEMQRETDSVDKLLSTMMTAKEKQKDDNLFSNDGEAGASGMSAQDFIDNIMKSQILSQTVNKSSNGDSDSEDEGTVSDAYGIASSLTESDKESAREALNNYETDDQATLDSIAAILGIER